MWSRSGQQILQLEPDVNGEEENPGLNLLPLSFLSEQVYLHSCLQDSSAEQCLRNALSNCTCKMDAVMPAEKIIKDGLYPCPGMPDEAAYSLGCREGLC